MLEAFTYNATVARPPPPSRCDATHLSRLLCKDAARVAVPSDTACSYKLKSICCGQDLHLPSLAAPSGGYSGNWPSEGTLTVRRRQRPLVASACGSWTPSMGTCIKRMPTAVNLPLGHRLLICYLDKNLIFYSSGNKFQMQLGMPGLTTKFRRFTGKALQQ